MVVGVDYRTRYLRVLLLLLSVQQSTSTEQSLVSSRMIVSIVVVRAYTYIY